jgi:hypothetical protein
MALIAYWVAHATSSWPGNHAANDTGAAQIKAGNLSTGSAASYSGTESGFATSGTIQIDEATAITGLSAGVSYTTAWTVWDDVANTYATPVVGTVTTDAGTTYNVSQAEAAVASDSGAAALVRVGVLTEAASATDTGSAIGVFGRTLTEPATASDLSTTGGVAAATLTEAASVTEAQSAQGAFGRTLTEPVSVSDLVVAVAALQAALTEAASAAEQQATGPVVTGTLTEAVSAAEVLATTANLLAAVLEAATAGDAYTTAQQLVALVSEPATAVDTVSAGGAPVAHDVSVTEMVAALDAIVGALAGAAAPWVLLAARTRSANHGGGARPEQLSTATRSNLQ